MGGAGAGSTHRGKLMDSHELKRSVACCGLVCRLCFKAAQCPGYRVAGSACPGPGQDGPCVHRDCCQERGLEGCWQCPDLGTCQVGLFAPGLSPKVKAFATFMRDEGVDRFIAGVQAGRASGLQIEKGGDYDGKPEAAVWEMLNCTNEH
jgi:hypothetical protein